MSDNPVAGSHREGHLDATVTVHQVGELALPRRCGGQLVPEADARRRRRSARPRARRDPRTAVAYRLARATRRPARGTPHPRSLEVGACQKLGWGTERSSSRPPSLRQPVAVRDQPSVQPREQGGEVPPSHADVVDAVDDLRRGGPADRRGARDDHDRLLVRHLVPGRRPAGGATQPEGHVDGVLPGCGRHRDRQRVDLRSRPGATAVVEHLLLEHPALPGDGDHALVRRRRGGEMTVLDRDLSSLDREPVALVEVPHLLGERLGVRSANRMPLPLKSQSCGASPKSPP